MFDIVLVSTDKAKKNHIKIEMILTSDTVKARAMTKRLVILAMRREV